MKRTVIIFSILLSFITFSCKDDTIKYSNSYDAEAAAIADSVRDIESLERYVEHYESLNEKRAALLVRQKLGSELRNKSDFYTAVEVHSKCIADAEEIKDTLQLIIALNNQGTNFRRIGDLEQASTNHYRALELCDHTLNDTSFVARKNRVRTLNGLGNVMLSLGNDEVAEDMFRRALKGEAELNSATGQAINYANIGAIKERKGELDSARVYYNMSMDKNRERNNLIGISLCYQNIGELDEAAGKHVEARENYLKSYEIGLQTKDIWHWLNPCTALTALSLKEGKIDEAERYNNEALSSAIRINAKGRLSYLYTLQAEIDEKRGDFKKALEHTKISIAYKDSADIEENRIHTQNLRVNYEINKRIKDVEEAEAKALHEKEMRDMTLWGSIIAIFLVLLAAGALVKAGIERKKRNILLEKTNRERQEFYRGITHQLRTPLTVVIGMTHELERFIPDDNEVAQKEFEAVTRKSKELLDLVTEMIKFNQGERDDLEVTELPKAEYQHYGIDLLNSNGEESDDYILVAEDDNDVALLITQMLKNQGYRFHWAHNGRDAYEYIKENMPRLIITDIMMPEMDGLELIKAIRGNEDTAHLPIIVVSARTENNDRLAGFDAGAEVYLGKPFIPDELLMMVRKLLEQRELLKKKYSQQIAEAANVDNDEISKGRNRTERDFIKQINEYISENIMDCGLNAAMLADHMIMSIATLNRKINSITGTNTTNYIRQRKLARAKYLLKNSSMSMGEIQVVCGFETPSYFSRTFRAEYGITPTECRKML